MFPRLLILVFVFAPAFAAAQENGAAAIKYFDRANDAKAKGQFHQADSLYTESLKWAKFASTYFNRALVRQKLKDTEGFCEDMAWAASMGDAEAWQLHCRNCGTWTVMYKDPTGMPLFDSTGYHTKTVVQGSPLFKQYFYTTIDAAGDTLDDFVVHRGADTVRFGSKYFQPAAFPGGDEKFGEYVDKNLHYPKQAKLRRTEGTVLVSMIVGEDGGIYNIKALREVGDGVTEEALRFARMLPRFKPAQLHGKPVASKIYMPLHFDTYRSTGFYQQRYVR